MIDYSVVQGQRSKLVKIEITGNGYFDTSYSARASADDPGEFCALPLGPLLAAPAGARHQRDRRPVSRQRLSRGQGNIHPERRLQGQARESVAGAGNQRRAAVAGPQPGDRGRADPSDDGYFRSVLRSIPGEPYSEANIAADRDTILNYYYNNGYSNATFDWTESPGAAGYQVDLHFVVRPGKQVFVRNIFVRGLRQTRPSLVGRRITLTPHGPISQARIGESQQKLYDLGIFSKVQTALQNPDGDEDSKNVLFLLDEASKYSFNVGFGAELARIGGGRHHLRRARPEPRRSVRASLPA